MLACRGDNEDEEYARFNLGGWLCEGKLVAGVEGVGLAISPQRRQRNAAGLCQAILGAGSQPGNRADAGARCGAGDSEHVGRNDEDEGEQNGKDSDEGDELRTGPSQTEGILSLRRLLGIALKGIPPWHFQQTPTAMNRCRPKIAGGVQITVTSAGQPITARKT